MADRTFEGPLDLQHAIDTTEDGGGNLWLDLHPPTGHNCPTCGTRLYGHSLFQIGTDDVLVVTYSCYKTPVSRAGSGRQQLTNSSTEESRRSLIEASKTATSDPRLSRCNTASQLCNGHPSVEVKIGRLRSLDGERSTGPAPPTECLLDEMT